MILGEIRNRIEKIHLIENELKEFVALCNKKLSPLELEELTKFNNFICTQIYEVLNWEKE